MNRRSFMMVLGSGLVAPKMLKADHHVISADPLEVEFVLNSLAGRYTSVEDFYIRNHFDVPASAEPAVLQLEGEIEKPRTLERGDLAPLPERKVGAVLECAGDQVGSAGLVSNGLWSGWRLEDILALSRPTPGAAHVHFYGRDGYKRSVPIERALADGMLVTSLNGRPLTRRHGAPWRVIFPGWYGMDSVKWLERIEVASAPLPPEGGTYQENIQSPSGEIVRRPLPRIQVKSLILDPQQGAVLPRGKVEIRGLAWSGAGKITSVEVSADGGNTWGSATLDAGTDFEWTLWKIAMELTQPGPTEFVARAKDANGSLQPSRRDQTRMDGYENNWYHRVRCVVT